MCILLQLLAAVACADVPASPAAGVIFPDSCKGKAATQTCAADCSAAYDGTGYVSTCQVTGTTGVWSTPTANCTCKQACSHTAMHWPADSVPVDVLSRPLQFESRGALGNMPIYREGLVMSNKLFGVA